MSVTVAVMVVEPTSGSVTRMVAPERVDRTWAALSLTVAVVTSAKLPSSTVREGAMSVWVTAAVMEAVALLAPPTAPVC